MYILKKILNPEIFQGKYKNKNYFEGWYYKVVDKNKEYSFALIPGIAFGKNKNGHSFIQIIDSNSYRTEYFHFDVSEFRYLEDKLEVRIEDSLFKKNSLSVNLKTKTS